jgi:lipopolysaccharide/colanic/teichoic acid biosynthesis glycosyltransferase
MDLLFLPQTGKKSDGMRSRFAFVTYRPATAVNFSYDGFYFVGKNSLHIEKMVQLYKRGYASEGLDNVRAELLRSLAQEKNVLPEVIICEASFDFEAIKNFSQFLRQHPVLSRIPFILDGSGLSEKELLSYRRNTKPDEILFIEHCSEQELGRKIGFLRKIKQNQPADAESGSGEYMSDTVPHSGPFPKRIFDVLVSSIALLLLSPLFLLIALWIKLDSRGPIFYISKRAGRGYRIFNFYKFRTMHYGADKKVGEMTHLNQYSAEASGPVFFKVSNDPRITRVGTFLRNTSLDELPQLINVFLGHMSIVGNRPLPLYEAVTLTTDDYAARFLAPAGMTGLWQIKKRGKEDMSVNERISMDIDYASKCNFATDFWIIANTPSAMIQKKNV